MYTFLNLLSFVVKADSRRSSGCVQLVISLLKPSRIEFVQDAVPALTLSDGAEWLEHIYRTTHPALRWLPTKLAEWIGENMQDELGFPDKADRRAHIGLQTDVNFS